MTAPDVAGPLVGYRSWRVSREGHLHSVAWDCAWPPGHEVVARCMGFRRTRHEVCAPLADCTCGVYALGDPDDAVWYAMNNDVPVIGAVALWGRVVVATRGVRAERCYPSRLVVVSRQWAAPGFGPPAIAAAAAALGARYRVPCAVVASWDQAAAALVEPAGGRLAGGDGTVPAHVAFDRPSPLARLVERIRGRSTG